MQIAGTVLAKTLKLNFIDQHYSIFPYRVPNGKTKIVLYRNTPGILTSYQDRDMFIIALRKY
jgi:hypothetical protein